ncbi:MULTISPECIES: DUF2752 domain-containing protein [unclassified Streptomyces]|uniref:DUF2752 domain-containing protein n=1 Tax=unclassified Streptomyces TaxID=2593676 RepID=UPI001F0401EE|nr:MULTISPECIES: DUF2752 domain-containing protein [unclassified Streptomyces]MCH0561705.1 DUF2752 domain-containing protein [Streptomyces sp. MUM 2J]MCH0568990.1 DUF2752 domain-containing protein [Streptomyces sp. MUM 136J]
MRKVPIPAGPPGHWGPRARLAWDAREPRWWLWGAAGAVVVLAGSAMAVWGMLPLNLHGPGHFAGVMAPSCGLTRSVVEAFRGDVAMAWRYNPAGLLIAFGSLAALARLLAGAATGRWLTLRVRPGRAGWTVLALALLALEFHQQGQAELLMTTGLR